MAATVAGSAMAGGGGFVLKSVREGTLQTTVQTFSVQNEGDFCVITRDEGDTYEFIISQIDDIPVNINTESTNLVFGKNIVVKSNKYYFKYHIFEYGPAE